MSGRFQVGILIVLVALISYLAYWILVPFFPPLVWAAVFAIVCYPIHRFFLRSVRYPSLAALITVVVVLIIIIGPLFYISYLLTGELQNVAANPPSLEAITEIYHDSAIESLVNRLLEFFNLTQSQAMDYLTSGFRNFAQAALKKIPLGLGNLVDAVTNFFVMVFVLFFFFRDGHRYVAALFSYLPFSSQNKEKLSGQIQDVVVSTIYGGLAVAIGEGAVALIGFLIVGVHSSVLWAVMTAITSFVPLVGSHVVWVPICIYFLFTGQIVNSIILAAFGVFGIGLVDNFVRPLFIRGRARMSFLLTFLAVFGGLQAFGLLGIVVGPLIMALFLSIIPMVRDLEVAGTG